MGDIEDVIGRIKARSPDEPEFHQAVEDVFGSLLSTVEANADYGANAILDRLAEPDRAISFRVVWEDDDGCIHVNRGWRVQFSNAIGPYKGGLRFHPSVNLSVLKFLGFEQIFKNALTGLPMGAAKGGADFDPKGRSDREIMRFCQSFMAELYRHVGDDIDVPAGDIGVGAREIGYMFGAYKRTTNRFTGVLTGKGPEYGGSLVRPEATGYGAAYFLEDMLRAGKDEIGGKAVVISGAGNVATHAAEKIIHRDGKALTLSDSAGFVHAEGGLSLEQIDRIKAHKATPGAKLADVADELDLAYHDGTPWHVPCDAAMPCATQNELDGEAAATLLDNGCKAISEGANMPCTHEAATRFREAGILFGPGKAANAGGVAMSGLEMSQNAARLSRGADDLRESLRRIMSEIHDLCAEHGRREDGSVDYVAGANIAGFRKVADAMLAFGVV